MQSYKVKKVFRLGFIFALSQWVQVRGYFSKLNNTQNQRGDFVQAYKDVGIVFKNNFSQWVLNERLIKKLNIAQNLNLRFVQVNKIMRATLKNTPSHSIHNEGVFKKLNYGFTFSLSHSLIYGG